jgi:uncharacterized LabA/DUF88 family protein
VSSDADFTPLVMHLRAKGAAVYGFGAKKTPEPFVNACSRFLFLETLGQTVAGEQAGDPAATPLRVPAAQLKQDTKLVTLLRNAVQAAAGEDGWARVGSVGQQIGNQNSFDPRNYGYATLSKLLIATQLFEVSNEGTSSVSVRDRRPAKASKAG